MNISTRLSKGILTSCAVWGALLGPGIARAENSATFRAGATYSDNLNRVTSDGAVSKSWFVMGLTADWATERDLIDTAFSGNVDYHTYSEVDFKSDFVGRADGSVRIKPFPGFFEWVVEDSLGQAAILAQQLDGPSNRQTMNFLSTGPDIFIPLGDRNRIVVQGRWADTSYEVSPDDSTRLSGALTFERRISQAITAFVRGNAMRVEYDDTIRNSAFDVQDALLGFHAVGVRTTLNVEGGLSMLHDRGERLNSTVARVELMRKTTPRSELRLKAGQEFSDSGLALRIGEFLSASDQLNFNTVVAGDPLRIKYANGSWNWAGDRLGVQLAYDLRRERREVQSALDVDRITSGLLFSYRISPRVSLDASLRVREDDFVGPSPNLQERGAGVGFSWLFNPRFSVDTRYLYAEGESGVGGSRYAENRIALTFGYTRAR